jgi:hypothetical protein
LFGDFETCKHERNSDFPHAITTHATLQNAAMVLIAMYYNNRPVICFIDAQLLIRPQGGHFSDASKNTISHFAPNYGATNCIFNIKWELLSFLSI